MASEAELMRICAPLYSSFALESLWTLILATFFAYLSVLISAKQQLQNPGKAVCRFVCYHFNDWVNDTYRVLKRWDTMHECDLGQRFRFCRRLNATICRIQVASAILAVTRWLHINNVNGTRYLGYSFTCPLMQAELVLLIAPAVPYYKMNVVFIMFLTWVTMITGWFASSMEGDLWTTDFEDVFLDGNFGNLTEKGKWVFPSMGIVLFLSAVQMPYMAFIYNVVGRKQDMPEGFNKMLVLTAISWLGFPIWWFLSYEGASVISDTKWNGLGFVVLNIISKGGFTLQMISMVKVFKRRQAAAIPSTPSKPRERSNSVASVESLPQLPGDAPEPLQRKDRMLPTGQSLVWMINAMKAYDGERDVQVQPLAAATPPSAIDYQPADERVSSANQLTNEELVMELMRRMDMSPDQRAMLAGVDCDGFGGHSRCGVLSEKALFEQNLLLEIEAACGQFVIDEETDDDDAD